MSIFDLLNEPQKEAVYHTEGPLLILAGAGSGKTRVLTHRIAYLLQEKAVNPWNILAITFTNKAAGEMRERVDQLIGADAERTWVSTFHSMCVRILRRYADRIGYDTNFTIYDTDDQKSMIKDICKYLQLDTKIYKERTILSAISSAKEEMILPEDFLIQAEGDLRQKKIAQAYCEYEKRMRANNAMDFDDLLLKTVLLFQTQPDVLEYYQERFRYIMVDEYQDTNHVQFVLVSLLAGKHKNLCVVGDDDQSIYKFRGADIRNILEFEQIFPETKVIKLEQNYRSTSTILNAANEVIKNNQGRKEKSLWTENEEGEKISYHQFDHAYDEAEYVVSNIRRSVNLGKAQYQDHAILYRTNAQSRMFEEKLVTLGIPYKIVGGINFYARKEIKDMLAYLKTIDNGKDDLSVRRIINIPKRGIGLTTIGKVQNYAIEKDISFYEALLVASGIPGLQRSVGKLDSFVALFEYFKAMSEDLSLYDLTEEILDKTGYVEYLREEADTEDEVKNRLENIEELKNKIRMFEENCEEAGQKATLSGFLEEVALVADIDSLDADADYVVLMTLHSAKGLEYPNVYLVGMEDGLFPSYMTIMSDDESELEEERRLCYVGITRAQKHLTLTCARARMIHGQTQYNKVSRFVQEIPSHLLAGTVEFQPEKKEKVPVYQQAKQTFKAKPFAQAMPVKQYGNKSADGLGYDVGDRVKHLKYGEGTVTQIVSGGRDFEVTVEFDQHGAKKMFAMFAKLQKLG